MCTAKTSGMIIFGEIIICRAACCFHNNWAISIIIHREHPPVEARIIGDFKKHTKGKKERKVHELYKTNNTSNFAVAQTIETTNITKVINTRTCQFPQKLNPCDRDNAIVLETRMFACDDPQIVRVRITLIWEIPDHRNHSVRQQTADPLEGLVYRLV